MKLDCRRYDHTLSAAKALLLEDEKPNQERIGLTALATQVPIIAVAHFYGREYGYNDKLNSFISRLCTFYDIDEVVL